MQLWSLATCLDTAFFGAIGIGEPHASSQFMLAKFDKKWPVEKTMFLTYSAKTLAEAAAGVGKQTDMVVVRPGHPIYALTAEDLSTLDGLHKQTSAKDEAARQEAYGVIRAYIEESAKKAEQSKATVEEVPKEETPQPEIPQVEAEPPVCTENLSSGVMVVKPAKDGV